MMLHWIARRPEVTTELAPVHHRWQRMMMAAEPAGQPEPVGRIAPAWQHRAAEAEARNPWPGLFGVLVVLTLVAIFVTAIGYAMVGNERTAAEIRQEQADGPNL